MTYTVVAAAELRGRIRERLADVRDRVRGEVAGDDPFLEALAQRADAPDVLARAERALAEFDTASISTIHGFAAAALGTTVGAVGPGEDRRRQAVADVLAVAAFDPRDADVRRAVGERRHVRLARPSAPRQPRPRPRAARGGGRATRGDGPPRGGGPCRRPLRREEPARRAPHLRRPPHRAGRRDRGGRRATPGRAPTALPRRAHRRVPGHRPNPVAHLRAALLGGAGPLARSRRRPEAGHLRLPRRRRRDLPPRARQGHERTPRPRRPRADHELPLGRPAARRPQRAVRGGVPR